MRREEQPLSLRGQPELGHVQRSLDLLGRLNRLGDLELLQGLGRLLRGGHTGVAGRRLGGRRIRVLGSRLQPQTEVAHRRCSPLGWRAAPIQCHFILSPHTRFQRGETTTGSGSRQRLRDAAGRRCRGGRCLWGVARAGLTRALGRSGRRGRGGGRGDRSSRLCSRGRLSGRPRLRSRGGDRGLQR